MLNYSRLPLIGSKNTRDFGGYPTEDGVIKFGQLFRSDSLSNLTDSDIEMLNDYHIQTILDLRHFVEIQNAPSRVGEHMARLHVPIIQDIEQATSHDYYKNNRLSDLYIDLLKNAQHQLKLSLEIILESTTPILFHCAAGKDRTGVISMLLLGILGVSNQDIIANYEVSHTHIKHREDMVGLINSEHEYLLYSSAGEMEDTLTFFYETYHSFASYYNLLGISDLKIQAFKNFIVDKK